MLSTKSETSKSKAQWRISFILTSLGCWTFSVLNDVCAEFDIKILFSRLSAEAAEFLSLKQQNVCAFL